MECHFFQSSMMPVCGLQDAICFGNALITGYCGILNANAFGANK